MRVLRIPYTGHILDISLKFYPSPTLVEDVTNELRPVGVARLFPIFLYTLKYLHGNFGTNTNELTDFERFIKYIFVIYYTLNVVSYAFYSKTGHLSLLV